MKKKCIFPLETGSICFLVNLKNYLSCNGIQLNEYTLAGLIGYMGFFYTKEQLPSKEIIHGRNGSFTDVFCRLQEILQNPLEVAEFTNSNDAIKEMNRLLNENIIPLVWIDDYYLEHSPYYNICIYKSLVPIIDISNGNIDYFDNGLRQICLEQFMKSIQFEGTIKIHHTCDQLYFKNMKMAITAGISSVLDVVFDNMNENDFIIIKGIDEFKNELVENNDSKMIFNFYYQLNRPSGLLRTRLFMSLFCKELEKGLNLGAAKKCAELYENLSHEWKMVANLLFKLSRTEDYELRQRIVSRMDKIISVEKQGFLELKSLLLSLDEVSMHNEIFNLSPKTL